MGRVEGRTHRLIPIVRQIFERPTEEILRGNRMVFRGEEGRHDWCLSIVSIEWILPRRLARKRSNPAGLRRSFINAQEVCQSITTLSAEDAKL